MISVILRGNSLASATKCMVKSEAIGFLFYSTFQRTSHVENYSLSNFAYKQKRKNLNIKNLHESGNIPKDFGRVIELGEDFRGLEDRQKRRKKQRFKSRGRNYAYSSSEREAEVREGEGEEVEDKEKTYDESSNITGGERRAYLSMDRNAHLLSSIMGKLRSKKGKEKNNEIVLEGRRIIYEAIKAGLIPLKIFFSRASDLENLNLPEDTKTYRIPYKAFKFWGEVTTPQGVIGIFQMPDENSVKVKSECLPLTVICDNIRDPGNLGSIIRIVASVGCEKLILTPGCTGVWEPKVLRASAGAHFHLAILKNYNWTDIENLISDTSKVFIADGHAISENESVENNNNVFRKISEISQQLPLTSYCSVEFENKGTTIVIGGETHGVSDEAYEFARKRNGTRVLIPLSNEMESLNSSIALAVLAFEYKRQLHCITQKESQQSATSNAASGIVSS